MKLSIDGVNTNSGKDAEAQFFTGLLTTGKISYFKLGEGGWAESDLYTEVLDVGDGTKNYSGTLTKLPVAAFTVTITDGVQALTDDGTGVLSGDGSGTVDYKSGEVTVEFDSIILTGTDIEAKYRYRGRESSSTTETLATGDGTIGTYYGAVEVLPVVPSSVTITDGGSQVITDDGSGNLTGDGVGAIDYATGEIEVEFGFGVTNGNQILVTYKYDNAPKDPDPSLTDLESEFSSVLYTFQKDFVDGDITFAGENTGRLVCAIRLVEYEGIDDGNGDPPVFFEGGLFSEGDVMLAYFTFNALWNDGSTEINIDVNVVI